MDERKDRTETDTPSPLTTTSDRTRPKVEGFQLLSPRETQLIVLAGEGLTDKEIAQELRISRGTVITLWSKVRAKLGISSRVSAVAVMSSVVARLSTSFPPFQGESLGLEGMLGRLSKVRLLINSRQIILTSSNKATSLLSLRSGLALHDRVGSGLIFCGAEGHQLVDAELPWVQAIRKRSKVLDFFLTAYRGGWSQDFLVDCYTADDPILSQVVVLDFKPAPGGRQLEVARSAGIATHWSPGMASSSL